MKREKQIPWSGSVAFVLCLAAAVQAQIGTVRAYQKISDTEGGFTGDFYYQNTFGIRVTSLGDLDGDGIIDIAVGASHDDEMGQGNGAVWILFLNADGTVKSQQKINEFHGNFTGDLGLWDAFGTTASLGDLDGDGVTDLAVGANLDDDGGTDRGAIWILFLNSNGTVKTYQKISDTQGNFLGVLSNEDNFGISITSLGDLDGDEVTDLAVGAWLDDDGGLSHGAVWILFLNNDGTVKSHQKISDTQGNFNGLLDVGDVFGASVSGLGDLDGDGVVDLVVGAFNDDDGGSNRGAIWILFLKTDGTVKSHQKISDLEGNFTGTLKNTDIFGFSVDSLGDVNSDGITDLAVGAVLDDGGGTDRGAIWMLFLDTDGTVKNQRKISDTEGNFQGIIDDGDAFGSDLENLGDLNGDGIDDLAVGAYQDDDGGFDHGAVWILFLDDDGNATFHVDGINGSDANNGFSRETAFQTIQKGIISAIDGENILAWPGVYSSPINFMGKAITVRSAADAAILEAQSNYAVSFYSGEGPDSVLENFVIRNSYAGIQTASGSSPTIRFVTVVDNDFGIIADLTSNPNISNSILWNNTYVNLLNCAATYSCIQDGDPGVGNISVDPNFADRDNGDFHLLSERGRYLPVDPTAFDGKEGLWVLDDVTSPCIDAGDPRLDESGERMPNGARVNLGAYGGTAYASRSEWPLKADLNYDGIVNLADFVITANQWLMDAKSMTLEDSLHIHRGGAIVDGDLGEWNTHTE